MFKSFIVNNRTVKVEVADTFFKRLRGLMFRKDLEGGLLIIPCNSIHMMFMHFPIDVVYLDRSFKVLKIVRGLRPWFGVSCCLSAHSTLELNSGEAQRLGLEVGQTLVPESNCLIMCS